MCQHGENEIRDYAQREATTRVCPKRDAICPHGMSCPYAVDRYTCKEEPKAKAQPKDSRHE